MNTATNLWYLVRSWYAIVAWYIPGSKYEDFSVLSESVEAATRISAFTPRSARRSASFSLRTAAINRNTYEQPTNNLASDFVYIASQLAALTFINSKYLVGSK